MAQFHQSLQREVGAREAGFHASERREIPILAGPEFRQIRQGGELGFRAFRLMMEADRVDELIGEVPLRKQTGADLAVIASQ